MGLNIRNYGSMIKNLLPIGLAWPRQDGTNLDKVCLSFGEELLRVGNRVQNLLTEAFPLTSSELLPDWERVTGLPEECEGLGETVQRRREAVDRKLASTGGQSPQYYIDVAARIGYTITIEEFSPFRVGQNRAGDAVYGDAWAFAWQINAPETTVKFFAAGEGAAGEPLSTFGNELLECVMNRIAPAHTVIIFAYNS